MTIPRRNWLRLALFVIVLGAMPLARANAAQITIKANANVVKALTFTSKQDTGFWNDHARRDRHHDRFDEHGGRDFLPGRGNMHRRTPTRYLQHPGTNKVVSTVVASTVNSANGGRIRFTPPHQPRSH